MLFPYFYRLLCIHLKNINYQICACYRISVLRRSQEFNYQGNKNLYCLPYKFREGQVVWAEMFLGTLG